MILKYLSKAAEKFGPLKDRVSIFNTANRESSAHGQACDKENQKICVEITQIYSSLCKCWETLILCLELVTVNSHKFEVLMARSSFQIISSSNKAK